MLAAGCGSTPDTPGLFGKAMQRIGISEPSPERARLVPVRLHGGENLNAGVGGRPSAVVLKIYQLRDGQRFDAAPFAAFLDEDSEKQALGQDLLAVDEIVLAPGARQERPTQVAAGTGAIGVVALFQAPANGRWRLRFDAAHADLERDGITLGVHACALTTSSPALRTRTAAAPSSLVSVRCADAR
ncbi:membrane protein [Luteimonas sp. FCS-9]|nr:membrane protein [Luteimonas sp. FCS-9]